MSRSVGLFLGSLAGLALLIGGATDGFAFPSPARWPVVMGRMILWAAPADPAGGLLLPSVHGDPATLPALLPGGSSGVGVAHLPNPFLLILTPVLGVLSCWLYRRVPNLYALGLAHGVLSFCIYYGLPRAVTFGLRVGPSFFGG